MSTAVATAVEIVTFQPESARAQRLFAALTAAAPTAGLEVTSSPTYRGRSAWLLLWGPGAPQREAAMRQHVAQGGRAIVADLAYWDRDRKARVSFDAAHPPAHVMTVAEPDDRWRADAAAGLVTLADRWVPGGPVLVAGLGDKARVQYGASTVDAWERAMIAACRERWPNRPIVYRKKRIGSPEPPDVQVSGPGVPIEQALRGASLVVTWHSNVAVDAIRQGIPVICRDGAAAAVCPSDLGADDPQPLDRAVRAQFLANLAYFQWRPDEASAFWRWVMERLS